jgi:hypothetical protein
MSDTNSESGDAGATTGGSPAAQAYREQLAKEGAALGALPDSAGEAAPAAAAPARPPPGAETRAAERKKVNGRAKVSMGAMQIANGKMIDMSLTGACIMLDDMIAAKKVFNLEVSIFQDGKQYAFSVQAVSVYSVLASGKGFKVGFQFGPRSPAAAKAIEDLVG